MNIFIFPRKTLQNVTMQLRDNPQVILFAVAAILAHVFPEFAVVFKIGLFDFSLGNPFSKDPALKEQPA